MPLPRAVPTAVRQTMQKAFEDLEKVITPQDSKDYHDCSLERVRLEALQIENQLGSRGWLRNMRRLKPLCTGLEHYSKVVDTLCNGTPFLPWIWAPITLILRIASEHIESFDSLIGAYGRIGSSLQRFEVLRKSFLGEPRFHEAAAAFYADILEFHKHAYKFVRRSGWKLLFSTSWGKFQRRFGNILENLKRNEDLIDRLVNAIDIAEARQLRQELSSWREQSLQKISLEDKEQSAKEFQAIQSWLRVNECDQIAIFESAAGPGNRFPGTCAWILDNTKIRSWLQKSPQSSILWLSGVAGSGKSVISSQLINFIRSRNDVVLYHFCTNLSVTSSEYEQVLKSLLEQLLRQDGDLTANVYHSYVLTKKVASVPILEQLLLSLLITSAEDPNQHSYIWIVLDGVDEIRDHSPNSQARLLNFVKQIVSKTTASESITCKAFISCRPSKTFSHILRQKPTVSLTDEKKSLGMAIQEYALHRLRSLETRFQQLGLTALEIENIAQQISVKSDGMFLYARLVLDFVSSNIFVRGDELRNSINQLPRELSSFYLQLLSQILAPLDENSKGHIECIFGWVAYARRPLRKSELLSAVGFSSGDPDTEFPAPQYILDVCRTLIEERTDTTLTFIHVSVKEFLQSSSSSLRISEEAALHQHCNASIACLLSSMKLLDQDRRQAFQILVRGVYGLQIYATEYWTEYLLCIVHLNGGLDRRSTLYNLLCQLSTGIDTAFQNKLQDSYDNDPCGDKRLDNLKEHQGIYRNVRKAILARSLKQLERRLRIESSSDTTKQPPVLITADGVSALLPQYQNLLLHIMGEMDVPGVSSRDLEAFRNEFSTSIHTCRLRTCPRATVGFETKDMRIEHEKSHVQRYPCTRLGCQYPPFLTPGSLKAHVRKEHDTGTPLRSIRRVKTTGAGPDTFSVVDPTEKLSALSSTYSSTPANVFPTPVSAASVPFPERGVSSETLGYWTGSSSARSQIDRDHQKTLGHLEQDNKRSPATSRQTRDVFSSGEPDQQPLVDRIWERSFDRARYRSAETSNQALQDREMELMRLDQVRMTQAHDDSSSGVPKELSSVEALLRIPLPSLATSSQHTPQDYVVSPGPSSPNFDQTSSLSTPTPYHFDQTPYPEVPSPTGADVGWDEEVSSPNADIPDLPQDFVSSHSPSSANSDQTPYPEVPPLLRTDVDWDGVSFPNADIPDITPEEIVGLQSPSSASFDQSPSPSVPTAVEDDVYGTSNFSSHGMGIPNTPSHESSRPVVLASPPLPPPHFMPVDGPQASHNDFVEQSRPEWTEYSDSLPLPGLTKAREDQDELPSKASVDGSVESKADIIHPDQIIPFPHYEHEIQKQRLQILQNPHVQMMAQKMQKMPQAAPTVTSAGPEHARKAALLEKLEYNPRERHAISTSSSVSQNSIPVTTPTTMGQKSSQQSQVQLLDAADISSYPFLRESPERISRATPSNAITTSSYWSVAEQNNFPELLRSFGTDWQAIAQHMTTKTAGMVINFFTKHASHEKPEWNQIATEADARAERGEQLPVPPMVPVRPRNKRSNFDIDRRAV